MGEGDRGLNFLAHALLGDRSPHFLLGAVLGDFVKGPIDAALPPDLQAGLRQHRGLDVYTDQHPAVRQARSLFERRRVAGILLDLAYDHFLSVHWHSFSSEPLPSFTQRVYGAFAAHEDLLPSRFHPVRPYMVRQDWLASYGDMAEVARVLNRMSRRLSRPELLLDSGAELVTHYAAVQESFLNFFPDVVTYSRTL
jgi:acyl carrier protein phosphodiesterase